MSFPKIFSKNAILDWSVAKDYSTGEICRGGGVLYSSKVVSGPSTSAGPKNPANDDGTYWTKVSVDDEGNVHKTTNEDIRGVKAIFNTLIRRNENFVLGTTPSTDQTWDISFRGIGDSGVTSCAILNAGCDTNNTVSSSWLIHNNDASGFFIGLKFDWATDNSRSFHPTNSGISLGSNSSATRWAQVYAASTTISTSDARLKTSPEIVPDSVLDAWGECSFVQFKMLDAVNEKGNDNARLHNGMIAQDIDSIFKKYNLDASKYGLFCYDKWNFKPQQLGQNGELLCESEEAGDQYSIRYEEALCMEAAYQRRQNSRMQATIETLEQRIALLEEKIKQEG